MRILYDPHWGKKSNYRPGGEAITTATSEYECRDVCPAPHKGLPGGNGCPRSPARKGMKATETGCFVCPIPDPEMCRWNAPAQWNGKK